jgi:subtilisin
MRMRSGLTVLAAALLVATMAVPAAAAPPDLDEVWIVTLDDAHPSTEHAAGLARRHGGSVWHVYEHALNGFSFVGSAQAAAALARSPQVRDVTVDQPMHAADHVTPSGVLRIEAPDAHLNGHSGDGVKIAILDTGIDDSHPALDVDTSLAKNCTGSGSTDDGNGHGTHVAGTASAIIGSDFVGAATHAEVVPVKVLGDDGSGSWSTVICGIDHVTGNSEDIRVANMSLGGSGSAGEDCSASALRQAICNSVDAGVVYTVAAGNSSTNVSNFVPAAYAEVITVSAWVNERCIRWVGGGPSRTECGDEALASFSNYGAGVDVIAPGVSIYSTLPGGDYGTKSGTSMAAPHVAGVAALMLAANPALGPEKVRELIQGTGECPDGTENTASSGPCSSQGQWFGDPDGIAEPMVNAPRAAASAGDPPVVDDPEPDHALEVDFTYECPDLTCTFSDTSHIGDDLDGVSHSWDFGDGNGATGPGPVTHAFGDGGTFEVTLTVTTTTDDGMDNVISATETKQVTVTAPSDDSDGGITLGVSLYKVRGLQKADLAWVGFDAGVKSVDILRDGSVIATGGYSGSYTDHIDVRGSGTYTYQVCETGTETCSPEVTESF